LPGKPDIQKLDENSLVVYVSEYYYGIAEQRKLDLAARRIGKVIKLTEENDAMRGEYREKAAQLHALIAKVRRGRFSLRWSLVEFSCLTTLPLLAGARRPGGSIDR
jgi:hypothetical protein